LSFQIRFSGEESAFHLGVIKNLPLGWVHTPGTGGIFLSAQPVNAARNLLLAPGLRPMPLRVWQPGSPYL